MAARRAGRGGRHRCALCGIGLRTSGRGISRAGIKSASAISRSPALIDRAVIDRAVIDRAVSALRRFGCHCADSGAPAERGIRPAARDRQSRGRCHDHRARSARKVAAPWLYQRHHDQHARGEFNAQQVVAGTTTMACAPRDNSICAMLSATRASHMPVKTGLPESRGQSKGSV